MHNDHKSSVDIRLLLAAWSSRPSRNEAPTRGGRFTTQLDTEIITMLRELGKVSEETKGGNPVTTESGFPKS
jgi:hypothetical protein